MMSFHVSHDKLSMELNEGVYCVWILTEHYAVRFIHVCQTSIGHSALVEGRILRYTFASWHLLWLNQILLSPFMARKSFASNEYPSFVFIHMAWPVEIGYV